jgi:hypothetical protein
MAADSQLPTSTLRGLHDQLREFVTKPENAALLRGTGDYSVLFRGTLFGLDRMEDVQSELDSGRRADILWLGANPNSPDSIKSILDVAGDSTPAMLDETYDRQIQYGYLGHTHPKRGGWDPLNNPSGQWRIYRDALDVNGLTENTLMANVIPWGSANMPSLLTALHQLDPLLTLRALRFVDDLNVQLVEAVRPKLVVLPLSIADNGIIRSLTPAFGLLVDSMEQREVLRFPSNGAERKRCIVGLMRRGSIQVPAVVLPHPSAWRCTLSERSTLIQDVASLMGRAIGLVAGTP